MRWLRRLFHSRSVQNDRANQQDRALDATLNDLRRVALELQDTNRAFAERVEVIKEARVDKPLRSPKKE